MRRVSGMVAGGARAAVCCALVLQPCFTAAARAEGRQPLAKATIQVRVKVFSEADTFNLDDCFRPGAPPECFTDDYTAEIQDSIMDRTKLPRNAFEQPERDFKP